jgi:hypothetical protein
MTAKPLEWTYRPNGFPPFHDGSAGPFGCYYCIEESSVSEEDGEGDGEPFWNVTDWHRRLIASKRSLEDAKAAAEAHWQKSIASVLVDA